MKKIDDLFSKQPQLIKWGCLLSAGCLASLLLLALIVSFDQWFPLVLVICLVAACYVVSKQANAQSRELQQKNVLARMLYGFLKNSDLRVVYDLPIELIGVRFWTDLLSGISPVKTGFGSVFQCAVTYSMARECKDSPPLRGKALSDAVFDAMQAYCRNPLTFEQYGVQFIVTSTTVMDNRKIVIQILVNDGAWIDYPQMARVQSPIDDQQEDVILDEDF